MIMSQNKIKVIIVFHLLLSLAINAATITVTASDGVVADNAECSIIEAIINANNNAQTHGDCVAGDGADTINLTQDITLTDTYENNSTFGRTGTPSIETEMILDGHDFVLARDSSLSCDLNSTSASNEFRLLRTTQGANLILQNITLANGCVDGTEFEARGGGLYNEADLTIEAVTFKQNRAGLMGGGIFHTSSGILNLMRNSLFVDNFAARGGAIYINESLIDSIENSTFSGNSADLDGGAIYNYISGINAILNSTFAGNSAVINGATIYNTANSSITALNNSLFVNNGPSVCFSNGLLNGSNNILDNSSSGGCPGMIDVVINSNVLPLANNGGPTKTHALLTGNKAIDVADTVINTGTATSADQRGVTALGIRDVGAYEYDAPPCPLELLAEGFTTAVSDAAELILAIKCSNLNGATHRDTIDLTQDITLIDTYDNHAVYGRTGTPPIETQMRLNGHGFTLSRDESLICDLNANSTANEFRLLRTIQGVDLNLQYIRISNGCVDGTDLQASGGGLYIEAYLLNIKDVAFTQNQAGIRGGGFYNEASIINMQNMTFSQNQAGVNGGGIFHASGTMKQRNISFVHNYAGENGGAIASYSHIELIIDSNFSDNSAGSNGGVIYNYFSTISSILYSSFSDNSADLNGGVIYNYSVSTHGIYSNIFSGNSAGSNGGAIYQSQSQLTYSSNNTFSENSAGMNGGAIYNSQSRFSFIYNSTFAENIAVTEGGAIYHTNDSLLERLDNSLFVNNSPSDCSTFNNSSINGSNNISDNPSGGCPSLIATLSASSVAPLADNGGATMTHALLAGSEAIDVSTGHTTTSGDQRDLRTDNIRDLGAYEVQVPVVTAPADIIMEATGATTEVSLGAATVTDVDESGLSASADSLGPFVLGTHTITWSAADSQGHIGSATQTVTITDNTAPTIILNDSTSVLIVIGDSYAAGATASDLADGDLTAAIIASGDNVDVNTAGIYVVTYTVTDQAGNTAMITQTINVQALITVSVSGMQASHSLELTTNGQSRNFTGDGSYSFNPVDNGTFYAVLLTTQPTSSYQTCVITGGTNDDGSGIIAGANATVTMTCTTNTATITVTASDGLVVDNAECSIIEAIINANNDAQIHSDCAGGDGVDIINLTLDVTLTDTYDNHAIYGHTGTPPVETQIILDGNGFSLIRDNSLSCNLDENITASEFRLLRTTQGADLILQNITLANGCADGIDLQASGGGLFNESDLIIEDVTFKQNQAYIRGGGVVHYNSALRLIGNSLFVDNHADNGGAIATLESSIDSIENSTFSGNSASISGGAINNQSSGIDAILNSTFSGNTSPVGGAIFSSNSTITALNNSLFHSNGNSDCDNSSGTFNGSNNISDNPSGGCPGLIPTVLSASTVAPLADNSGLTMTHALLAGSQAIDTADTVTNTGTATSADQRGFATDNIRDIGAYEVQVPVVTAPADITMEATGAATAVTLGTATVTDVDEPELSASADNLGPFVVGTHTVTWSVVDSQGHVGATQTQTVTITDNTAPIITLNDSAAGQIVIGGNYTAGATANDLVDGDLTAAIITAGDSVDVNTAGIYVVTYTVTDQAGNTTIVSQTINVQALISVSVSGLHASHSIELTTNGQTLNFTGNGSASFNPIDNNTVYAVLLTAQPTSPNQTCVITGGSNNDGSGVVTGANVDIVVTCTTNVYYIGGITMGLIPDNNLVLQNNLGDDLLITDDGIFIFSTAIEDLQGYDITIFLQPDDPVQNCTLSNTAGNIAGTDVLDVSVDCEFGDDMIFRHGFEEIPAITVFDLELLE